MDEAAAGPVPRPLTRRVGAGALAFVAAFAAVSLLTGQRNIWLGDLAQLAPPLAFALLVFFVAHRSTGQARAFWSLNGVYALIWIAGQIVWTYLDLAHGKVPTISPTDPIFFAATMPLAAALYGRPDHDRPRWLFDIVLLDIVLIALFAAFAYAYFVVTLAVTDGREDVYNATFTQLMNVRNALLALWAAWLWRTAASAGWRRVLGLYCAGLTLAFAGGVLSDVVSAYELYAVGSLWDLQWMIPFLVLALAPAQAYDTRLFTPAEPARNLSRLPVVSLIAVGLLIMIPAIDEVARRTLDFSPATEALRTRLALTVMIPFGFVVFVREFLSRRALVRASQELVATREQLAMKEKLAAVGQLVSGVAHELNNPLQGVLGYAELMAHGDPEGVESEELKAIRDNAARAAGIVRNLLSFAGGETPVRSWQQVNRIVRDSAAKCADSLAGEEIQLRLHLADRLPLLYVDAVRFEQVVVNLIENAREAIEARRSGQQPEAVVEAHVPGEIIVQTSREANPDRIVIAVADNGSGVPVEDFGKLFEPFFTTRGVGQGPGLGLSVCYGIVREHGGQIHAQNRDSGGAIFTVELPVTSDAFAQVEAPAAAAPAAPRPAPAPEPVIDVPAAATRRARALVVDDEDSNAALVRRALDQAGFDVESTTLSRRALIMIERSPYDVVIADVRMPEMSGPELYSRACQIRPEMARRFIFITGDIDGDDTLNFLQQTQCGYFLKPFNLERLTSAVELLVSR